MLFSNLLHDQPFYVKLFDLSELHANYGLLNRYRPTLKSTNTFGCRPPVSDVFENPYSSSEDQISVHYTHFEQRAHNKYTCINSLVVMYESVTVLYIEMNVLSRV